MSDLLTKASGCYSEIVKYFSKYENIHLSHNLKILVNVFEFHSGFIELKKMAEDQLFNFLQ